MISPYNIFLDTDIVRYLEDLGYLVNKETKEKEEVIWSQGGLLCVGSSWYSGKELMNKFLLPDGSPCGFVENESFFEKD